MTKPAFTGSGVRCYPAGLVLLLILLGGCGGGSAPIRYYLIDPVPAEPLQATDTSGPAVDIVDLYIPQYLDRFHIATRTGTNRLDFSGTHQWGENLRENLLRSLARNLSQLLGTVEVATPLARSSFPADVRLLVFIERFERAADGRVRLEARWQVSRTGGDTPARTRRALLAADNAVAVGDYEAMVSRMQALFGELSRRIAESILSVEDSV